MNDDWFREYREETWRSVMGRDDEGEMTELRSLLVAKDAEIARWEHDYQEREHDFQSLLRDQAAKIARLREALDQAEAVLSIVEPRSNKAEYLRILGVVRAALGSPAPGAGE